MAAAATVTYPTRELREALERTASDPSLDPASRARELRQVRDEIAHLAGYADTLLGDLQKADAAGALAEADAEAARRDNADLREEMLRRGLATPEELDALGYHSHDALDAMRGDGTLHEALHARAAPHALGDRPGGLDEARFRPELHPRDRLGHWADKPDAPGYPGRPAATSPAYEAELRRRWADLDRALLPYAGDPRDPRAREIVSEQLAVTKVIHHLSLDRGGPAGVGEPGGPRDVVVVGAGPAGLSAAIYGTTEGLDTLLLDEEPEPGGQARASSRIENVAGFPAGVAGRQYAGESLEQARRLGAETELGVAVAGMTYDRGSGLKTLALSDGRRVEARSVVIAGGVQFRHASFPGSDAGGVVYGDSTELKRRCKGSDAVIVGGANSAGQAAVDVASEASRVTVLVRRGHIEDKMSSYLVAQLRSDPRVTILEDAEVASAAKSPDGSIESVTLRDGRRLPCRGLGLFIGSSPRAEWAGVDRDERGYVRVGGDGRGELETSVPGVYAAGDVRAGAVRRVITAAADGAHAIALAGSYVPSVGAPLSEAASGAGVLAAADALPDDAADAWMARAEALDREAPFTDADEAPPPGTASEFGPEDTAGAREVW